jgi:hypothetical protein
MACGFEVRVGTAWRYVREAVDLFAAAADGLDEAMKGSADGGQMGLE